MRTRAPIAIGALVAASALVLTGCSSGSGGSASGNDDVIRFATLPLSDDPNAATPVETIAALLEEETGLTVEVTDVPSYSAVIEAIRAGHEDIGIMSGFPSALAVNTGEIDSLVAWPGNGDPVSTCLVLDSSPLRSLDDVSPDTTVAFADPASSSGYFLPIHMLHEAGLEMDSDYEVLISGGHDRSFLALKNGQADVACTATIFPTMAGTGNPMFPFEAGETRSIGESISMPVSTSVLGNPGMSDAKRQALIEALPKVFSPQNKEALGIYGEGIGDGSAPIIEPDAAVFQPYVDIAAVANVDISDLE